MDGAGLVLTEDQKIIVAGRAISPQNYIINTIARFNSNGTKDLSFGNAGKITISLSEGNNIIASLLLNSNQFFEAGYCTDPNSRGLLAKFILKNNENVSTLTSPLLSSIDQVGNSDIYVKTTPNPSHSSFIVKVKPSITNQPVELRLVSIDGILIQHVEKMFPGQEAAIGNAEMPSGIYFLQVIRQGSIKTTKLLKF